MNDLEPCCLHATTNEEGIAFCGLVGIELEARQDVNTSPCVTQIAEKQHLPSGKYGLAAGETFDRGVEGEVVYTLAAPQASCLSIGARFVASDCVHFELTSSTSSEDE